ncbi:MAG: zinc ribbon domain-containing protein [Anaerolineae bacterium]
MQINLGTLRLNLEMLLNFGLACFGAYFLAFWVSLVIWTFRDVRSRSRDIFAQLLATLMVLIFNLPGLFLYYILRPHETLAAAYERELEEEALLQDIKDRQACPSCKQTVQPNFLVCPSCHTKLKKLCPHCERLLHLKWNVCPYCGNRPTLPLEEPLVPLEEAVEG